MEYLKEIALYLRQFYEDQKFSWETMNIFGIRNQENYENDSFNDFIGYEHNGNIYVTRGTTDPGNYYTDNPIDDQGVFHLSLGYHKEIWRLRKHMYLYMAFCNDWKTGNVRGWRDKNKNHIDDDNIISEGQFGVNLHAAGFTKLVQQIGKYSAGCQVIQDSTFFVKMIENAESIDQKLFSYYLFDIKTIPENFLITISNQ